MTTKPEQILYEVNDELRQHIQLLKTPTAGRFISQKEFESIPDIHRASRKTVGTTGGRVCLAQEILESKNFKTCIPIIVQDQLNDYAGLGHFRAGEPISMSASNIAGALNFLPKGSLLVKLLHNNNSYDIRGVEGFMRQCRSDIIDIEHVRIPDVGAYFDVIYDPRTRKAYIKSLSYGDMIYEISGFDLELSKKLPGYENLKYYFAADIAQTFFL